MATIFWIVILYIIFLWIDVPLPTKRHSKDIAIGIGKHGSEPSYVEKNGQSDFTVGLAKDGTVPSYTDKK